MCFLFQIKCIIIKFFFNNKDDCGISHNEKKSGTAICICVIRNNSAVIGKVTHASMQIIFFENFIKKREN